MVNAILLNWSICEEFVVGEFVVGSRVAESASNNLSEKYNQIFFWCVLTLQYNPSTNL